MSDNTMKASSNPELANDLISKALNESTAHEKQEVKIKVPSDNLVTLPGGYINADGEVIKSVEVRELNGRDEEAISKATTVGRMLNTVLTRGVSKIGDEEITERLLDNLLAGDREAILLGVYKVTFGNPAELSGYCRGCEDYKQVEVDLDADVEMKSLENPIADRKFTVKGKKHEYTVGLPTGVTQKELNNSLDKTVAEMSTILLQNTVLEIDGDMVVSKSAIQNMSVLDRRKVSEAIADKNPGPVFNDITVTCPDCESEVVVPINLGTLFQF